MADLAKLVVRLEAETSRYQKELDRAKKQLGLFDRQASESVRRVAAAAGAAAIAAGAAFAVMAKKAVDSADSLSKLSQSSGVSTESLSQLRYAAELSGTDIEGLSNGLRRLSSAAADAASGVKAPQKAFAALGVSVENADGSLRSTEDLLLDIAESFSQYEDGAGKAALAQDLFGRSGTQLIPLLNEGRAGIERLKNEADSLGLTLTDKAGKAAEQFNDNLDRLKAVAGGVVNQAVQQLLPSLEVLSDSFVDSAKGAAQFSDASNILATGLKLLIDAGLSVSKVFNSLGKALGASAAAIVQFAQGNFRQAWEIIKARNEDGLAENEAFAKRIQALWDNSGEAVVASAQKHDKEIRKTLIFGGESAGIQEFSPTAERLEIGPLEQFYERLDDLTKTTTENAISKYEEQRAALNELYSAGAISAETFAERSKAALDEFLPEFEVTAKKITEKVTAQLSVTQELMEELARDAQGIIANTLKNGFDDGIDGILKSVGQMIADITAQIVAADLARRLFGEYGGAKEGSGGGLIGAALGFLGGFFGGTMDSGGRGQAGMAYAIGTGAQPEMFVPDSAGTFIPAGDWGGKTENHFNFALPAGVPITRQTEQQIAAAAFRGASMAARRN